MDMDAMADLTAEEDSAVGRMDRTLWIVGYRSHDVDVMTTAD
jgi:hypothetical protein